MSNIYFVRQTRLEDFDPEEMARMRERLGQYDAMLQQPQQPRPQQNAEVPSSSRRSPSPAAGQCWGSASGGTGWQPNTQVFVTKQLLCYSPRRGYRAYKQG